MAQNSGSTPPQLEFGREAAASIIPELKPLLEQHYEEIAHFKEIPLDPDFDQYIKLDEAGVLRIFTVRTGVFKELIGYAIFLVRANLHYQTSLQAGQDIIFIRKDMRGSGQTFVEWCDSQLKAEGVQAAYHHVKAAHNFGPMLERVGYKLVDLIYGRLL